MTYLPNPSRYKNMPYRRCGKSGLKLPAVSLGLWHNFGAIDTLENGRNILKLAFDSGITHFDLANNYGPPAGSAESTFGKIFKDNFKIYRDELIISTKAGWGMWEGPYGDWGSKKYLVSSLDQSLNRMGLDYVDIFAKVIMLSEIAVKRGQDLAQMALSWILKDDRITSVLIGVSKPEQLTDSLQCLNNVLFSEEELKKINSILG